ncbi:hypothetical protein J3R30DRAFT_3277267 [Lentinula aciculospora]|uniref:Uncharacterized protein n=1 Tax=Lentinula aciculospora TaxID=153920 RepID=A0A9W9DXG3_9AGAR|nr:hypothetical protein J3R30DRAFT_3277267 [Lentinula aciculospora]
MSTPVVSTREDTPTSTSSGIQLARDADLLIRTYIPSSLSLNQPQVGPPIPLPLCIPQASVNPNDQSTFARAYNDTLKDIGIPQDVFLNFIDGLNMAIIASPPLRVVDMAGKIIGFIPYHWAMIAGALISTAAGVATHILSKTLTDRFLRAANLNIFKPRGLSARLCTTPAMLSLLTSSESKARSKLNKFGRGVGSVLLKLPLPVINPIASTIIHAISDKPPAISPSGSEGDPIKSPVLRRRIAITEGLALPLNMDNLPPPAKPEGVVDTMASWGVRFDTAREKFSEKNIERRRRALESIKQAGIEPPSRSMGMLGSSSSMTSRVEQQRNASFQNFGRGNVGLGSFLGPKRTRMEQKVADADLLEYWGEEKFLWVVIMASDKADEEIADIAIAEDPADEERIDDRTWRERMAFERDEMELEDLQELQQQQQQQQQGSNASAK